MVITKIYNCIGWSKFRNDTIQITNYYSPSNDYEGTEVKVEAKEVTACSEREAVMMALSIARPEAAEEITEVTDWLLRR